MSDSKNTCGETIRTTRLGKGLDLKETAALAGISDGRLRQVELGYQNVGGGVRVKVRPTDGLLTKIAGALDLDAKALVAMARRDDEAKPDAKDIAHEVFAQVVRADPTLDAASKTHIINQHALLQRVAPLQSSTADELDTLGKKKLRDARTVRNARKRQTPEGTSGQ